LLRQVAEASTGRGSMRDLFGRSAPLFAALLVDMCRRDTTPVNNLVDIYLRTGVLHTCTIHAELEDFRLMSTRIEAGNFLVFGIHQRILFRRSEPLLAALLVDVSRLDTTHIDILVDIYLRNGALHSTSGIPAQLEDLLFIFNLRIIF
jgi:hypothetical protein